MSNFWYKGISSVSLVSAILAVANDHQDSSRPCVHLLSMQQRPRPQRLRIGSVAASPGKQAKLSQSSPNTNHQAVPQLTTRWIFFVWHPFFRLKKWKGVPDPKKTRPKKRPLFFSANNFASARNPELAPEVDTPAVDALGGGGRKKKTPQSMVKIIQFIWRLTTWIFLSGCWMDGKGCLYTIFS